MKYSVIFLAFSFCAIQITFMNFASNDSYLRKSVEGKNIFASFQRIETERLIIRRMQEADCADLFAMMSDPDVVGQTIALEVHHDIGETRDLLKAILTTYSDHPSIWSIFAITQKSDNKFIGYCGYYSYASACKRAEIGYALCKEFWGKGIVPEACKALVQYGFKDLDLERIEATVYPENIGSVRVLEKLGLQLEGVLRNHVIRDGVCRNRLIYSLLKDEWRAHNSPQQHKTIS